MRMLAQDPSRTEPQRLATLCHALSDPTRLRIMELLHHGERCVCDLTAASGAGQSRLSFHLKTLKDAGLVSDRRVGRWVYYALRPEGLAEVGEALAALKPHTSGGRPGCCA